MMEVSTRLHRTQNLFEISAFDNNKMLRGQLRMRKHKFRLTIALIGHS